MPVNVPIHPPQRNTKDTFLSKNPLQPQHFLLKCVLLCGFFACVQRLSVKPFFMAKSTPEQLAAALRQNLRRRKKTAPPPSTPVSTLSIPPSQQKK
jgi:hypothetical protein